MKREIREEEEEEEEEEKERYGNYDFVWICMDGYDLVCKV